LNDPFPAIGVSGNRGVVGRRRRSAFEAECRDASGVAVADPLYGRVDGRHRRDKRNKPGVV